jgi:glycerol-1-phosphate dehydrogenase [NAD(P)+]
VRETFAPIDPTGQMGEACWGDYRTKLEGWHRARAALESFLAGWESERAALRELVAPAEECVEAIANSGLPMQWEDLPVPIPEHEARWAYANAHLMRHRFSHVDLLHFLGWFDESFVDRVFTRVRELADSKRGAVRGRADAR